MTSGDFGSLLIPVAITVNSNEVYLGPVVRHEIVSVADHSVQGEVLEKSGRTTGRTIGEVNGTCVDQNVANLVNGNAVDTGLTMLCQDKMGALAWQGDSGSPVYKLASSPDGKPAVKLYGVAWTSNGQEVWFSPMSQVTLGSEMGNLKTRKGENPDSKPEVKILSPTDGSTVPLGQSVTLKAAAVDYEDAVLDFTGHPWTAIQKWVLARVCPMVSRRRVCNT